jgi:hypothetical protein
MCLRHGELVRSHLLPAALYGYCRKEDVSPIRVGDGVVYFTDRQTQDYLLCAKCEDKLNKGGESWVNSKLASIDPRQFPLYDLIVSGPAAFADETGGIYYAADNPDIDVDKLIHFAIGIFWKASVHSWKGGSTVPKIDLDDHSEALRKWLMRDDDLPRDMSLHFSVSRPDRAQIILQEPIAVESRTWKTFVMHVPGMMISMNVGGHVPIETHMVCFWKNSAHAIMISERVTEALERKYAGEYAESRKTRSFLATRAKQTSGRN